MGKELSQENFKKFIKDIKQKILSSQYGALKAVNKELIKLYWEIGRSIVKKQEQFSWGKSVVKELSQELQKEFVGMEGFSERNFWNMKNFYLECKNNEKMQTLSAEIGWSHNVAVFQKCKNNIERESYIRSTIKFGWTYRILINHIENRSYEKFLLNQMNFDNILPEKYRNQAKLAVKDEYIFDFLELNEEHSEYELEINNL